MNLYRSKEWKLFREAVLRLGGAICSRCFTSASAGAKLHVHHKFYVLGRKPWEYDYDDCEILCQSCHAQEHGIIPPKTGWEFVGYDDLGTPDGHCDYCGTAIRHVFMIQHEKWSALEVGETCCDNLTTTNFATVHMKERQRFLARQKRFASRWNIDSEGAHTQLDGMQVRIVEIDRAFKLRINGKLGKQSFESPLDAKIRAFEVIDSGEVARYFKKSEILAP